MHVCLLCVDVILKMRLKIYMNEMRQKIYINKNYKKNFEKLIRFCNLTIQSYNVMLLDFRKFKSEFNIT